ncbi:response regulator [Pedobacter fastidiosus]|uniref:Response regulator transcription factor n=1 Tax=Pedobacter fastidiosus TaxID=2765361 RepID=A0ABR7KUA5_9SPHI|nr:response regulator transcription factor [Pedobacter fastidiosus]MBC6111686.1 response regulator transcription factor [Pedobacter fastidiosus]
MKIPIKVLLADDHTIVRNGIISLLRNESSIEIISEASNGTDVINQLKAGLQPDIIVTDINLSGINGIELTTIIRARYPKVKIIILTTLDHENYVSQSLDAGASGFLLKNVNIEEVIFAIKNVALGYKYVCTAITIKLLAQSRGRFAIGPSSILKPDIELSKREIEILALIADGFTNSEIAEKLFTSKRTIEGNRQSLLDKTGKKNTAALINFVVRNGIID